MEFETTFFKALVKTLQAHRDATRFLADSTRAWIIDYFLRGDVEDGNFPKNDDEFLRDTLAQTGLGYEDMTDKQLLASFVEDLDGVGGVRESYPEGDHHHEVAVDIVGAFNEETERDRIRKLNKGS